MQIIFYIFSADLYNSYQTERYSQIDTMLEGRDLHPQRGIKSLLLLFIYLIQFILNAGCRKATRGKNKVRARFKGQGPSPLATT